MFGLPLEVITMLGSTIGGAVMRVWSQSKADKAEQWKMALEAGRETELGESTQVPIISTEGFKLLFLDFTHEVTEYIQLEGLVTPEWLSHSIMAVVGLYFGSSITSRK